MEKCPPAEACRDAFERMSKATVQMCMSTTGFGFRKDGDRPSVRPTQSLSTIERENNSNYPGSAMDQYSSQAQQPYVRLKRPPPKFDMNLRDLFPEDLDHNDLPSQSLPSFTFAGPPAQQQQPPPQQRSSQPMIPSPTSKQQSVMNLNSQINVGLGMGSNLNTGEMDPLLGQENQAQSTPFYNSSIYGSDFAGVPALNFLNPADGNDFNDTSTIDLGFGMGMDFQHDWSDGTQFDLFDGFFFGNGAS